MITISSENGDCDRCCSFIVKQLQCNIIMIQYRAAGTSHSVHCMLNAHVYCMYIYYTCIQQIKRMKNSIPNRSDIF